MSGLRRLAAWFRERIGSGRKKEEPSVVFKAYKVYRNRKMASYDFWVISAKTDPKGTSWITGRWVTRQGQVIEVLDFLGVPEENRRDWREC